MIMPGLFGVIRHMAGSGPVTPATPAFAEAINSINDLNVASRTVAISGVAGNLWLAWQTCAINDQFPIAPPTASGAPWNDLFSVTHANQASFAVRMWWKRLAGAESNPVFNVDNGTSDEWGCGVLEFTGANAVTPIGTEFAVTASGMGTSMTCPSLNTQGPNRRIVRLGWARGNPVAEDTGYPAGTTGIFLKDIVGAENSLMVAAAHQAAAAAGSVGTASYSGVIFSSSNSIKATIAIRG